MARFVLSLIVFLAFTIYTFVVIAENGVSSLFDLLVPFTGWGAQVLIDLVIACVLVLIWISYDVRQQGWGQAMAVPFYILTVSLGSVGLLAYFTVRNYRLMGQGRVTPA